jgi:hypothetical protein
VQLVEQILIRATGKNMTIEEDDVEFIKQQQAGQADIDRINQLITEERTEVQRQEEEARADIEQINRTCISFQLTIPPAISENLAWMPCLQPPY